MKEVATGGALAPVENVTPTLSDALEKWLERETSARADISPAGQTADWWEDFDNCGQLEIAARVRRGFRLAQIRAASERDFQAGLKRRDVAITSAYELIDTYKLFVAFPSLPLMDRAAALGFARIRELKPHLGIDGIRALIEGKEVDTLMYDAAVAMTKREIVAWRKARFTALLEREQAKHPVDVPDIENTSVEPRALIVGRDEFLSAIQRVHLEIDRAKDVLARSLRNETDEFKPARMEVAHAAHQILQAAALQLRNLDETLVQQFGALVTRPADGEYHTLPYSSIVASNNRVLTQAEADQAERAKSRAAAYKWRGAPPKTLDAAITQALNADHE